jgi:hypothetical protein
MKLKMTKKIEVYRPVYMTGKNKFLRYELEEFDDKHDHKATIRIAVFLDKNNAEQRSVAQVMWK